MRYTVLLLLLLPAAACEDALGPAGGCTREMRSVRNKYGDDYIRSEDRDGDVFREIWFYPPDGNAQGRTVTFRWGTELPCEVSEGSVSALFPAYYH